jgi:hypothetical protein
MPINDKVTSYTVAFVRNDVVQTRHTIRLSLESGGGAELRFDTTPPATYLAFNGNQTTVWLDLDEYQGVYHLLQTESPLFFTALNLFGLQAVNLSSTPEPLGEGFSDADLTPAAVTSHT